jgi:NTP pyrophosphatase (non-canonical NTP hydrolase)
MTICLEGPKLVFIGAVYGTLCISTISQKTSDLLEIRVRIEMNYGSKGLYEYLWSKYGTNAQLNMVLEEQAELAMVILKGRRKNTLGLAETRMAMADEIADNIIMLEQLTNEYHIQSQVDANIAYKLARIAQRAEYTGDQEISDHVERELVEDEKGNIYYPGG